MRTRSRKTFPRRISWRGAREDAEALEGLFPRLFSELRRIARAHLRSERAGHTLQPTALVHEAFLRLGNYERVEWQGRAHFLSVASRVMRRMIVDHARRRKASKRGREALRVTLNDAELAAEEPAATSP